MIMKNDNENENENVNDNLNSIYIEGIRTVFVLYFFMKDTLNIKNTNKSTSSNFYPYDIHKQKHLSNFHLDNMS